MATKKKMKPDKGGRVILKKKNEPTITELLARIEALEAEIAALKSA